MIAMTLTESKMKHDLQILAYTYILSQKQRKKQVYGTVELSLSYIVHHSSSQFMM